MPRARGGRRHRPRPAVVVSTSQRTPWNGCCQAHPPPRTAQGEGHPGRRPSPGPGSVGGLMRIAMLGPVAWRTPPLHYGPWEQVTSLLTEGLVAAGVDVTLFATLDSVTTASLDGVCARGYAQDLTVDGRVWEALHVSHALARSGGFDLVHNQMDWLPLAFHEHAHVPMVTTIHGFSGSGIMPAYRRAASAYVAISESDRSPDLDYVA